MVVTAVQSFKKYCCLLDEKSKSVLLLDEKSKSVLYLVSGGGGEWLHMTCQLCITFLHRKLLKPDLRRGSLLICLLPISGFKPGPQL